MIAARTIFRWSAHTAIALVIFLASAELAYRYLAHREVNPFGDLLPQSLMLACGYALTSPVERTPALVEFLQRNRESVTCADSFVDVRRLQQWNAAALVVAA